MQALATLGWSQRQLALRVGLTVANLTRLINSSDRDHITAATAISVTAAYEELWDQPPPAQHPGAVAAIARVKKHAQQRGWVASRFEWILATDRPSRTTLSERLGVAWPTVEKALHRAGRRDLLDRIAPDRDYRTNPPKSA